MDMRLALLIFASALLFISFSKKEKEDPFYYKNIEKSMCLIPGGMMDNDSLCKPSTGCHITIVCPKIYIDSFYLSNHEVTNLEYREFVNAIAKDSGELYKKFLPDTLIWRDELAYNEEYIQWYFRHPAYNNYPVVGVSYEQAKDYCEWLTKKYMSTEKRKYKNVVFKLPKLNQWTYAAKGRVEAQFPFKNGKLMNKKGEYQATFKIIEQENIKMEKEKTTINHTYKHVYIINGDIVGSYVDYVYPTLTYSPNHFNIYNLAGNVEEYVAEKGITKGGGWKDTGYYLQNFVCQTYDSTNATSEDRGFRVAMEIIK